MTDRQRKDLNNMCSSAFNVKLGEIVNNVQISPIPDGTPVNAKAAEGKLVIEGDNVSQDDVVTIGDVVYTFKDEVDEPYEVKVGNDNEASAVNLVKAVTEGDGEGSDYGTNTEEHPDVTAEAGKDDDDDNEVRVTAKVKGEEGNEVVLDVDADNAHWSDSGDYEEDNLAGGVDGTEGVKWQQYVDEDYIYVAIEENTVNDDNWKRISLSTF